MRGGAWVWGGRSPRLARPRATQAVMGTGRAGVEVEVEVEVGVEVEETETWLVGWSDT